MNKLVLFCVETRTDADTDWPYIQRTIKRFYIEDRKIVRRHICMGTKTKYKSRAVIRKIDNYRKEYNNKITVIYCIDIDNYDISTETKELVNDIKEYCEINHYDFVFFCKDVEDVYWGEQVDKKAKVQKAKSFNKSNRIDSVEESQLRKTIFTKNSSNILAVLDRYFIKKC